MNALVSERGYTRPTRGILLIGDPHVWSKKPGTRRDESFMDTVIGKIEQAGKIANDHDLWPFFLGDLLHDDMDNNTKMLLRLARALRSFDRKPVTLTGNHDKEGLMHLSEDNALLLLGETCQLDIIDSAGFWGVLTLEDIQGAKVRVAIGGTPYGTPIPTEVGSYAGVQPGEDVKKHLNVDHIVWLTHEDLAFGSAYPGATPLHEIHQVDVAVNGHMHAPQRPHMCGQTAWYNPGNITRLSVDLAGQKPSVWAWSPFGTETVLAADGVPMPALTRFVLKHTPPEETFNFEGRHAVAESITQHAHRPEMASDFVQQLKADFLQSRTDDGTYLAEAIANIALSKKTPEPAQAIVQTLFVRALEEPEIKTSTTRKKRKS